MKILLLSFVLFGSLALVVLLPGSAVAADSPSDPTCTAVVTPKWTQGSNLGIWVTGPNPLDYNVTASLTAGGGQTLKATIGGGTGSSESPPIVTHFVFVQDLNKPIDFSSYYFTVKSDKTGLYCQGGENRTVSAGSTIVGGGTQIPGCSNPQSDQDFIERQLSSDGAIKSGDRLPQISFFNCYDTSAGNGMVSAGVLLPDGSEPVGSYSDQPCKANQQCYLLVTVPFGFTTFPTATVLRINILGQGNAIYEVPITIVGAGTVDPCLSKKTQAERTDCETQLSCKASLGTSATIAELGACAAKITCNQMRGDGYVYTSTFAGVLGDGCHNLTDFVQTLLNYIMTFAALIAGGMFAYGSFNILVSKGDPAAVANARGMLTNAVIGLILIAIALIVTQFLSGALAAIPGAGINLAPLSP